MHIPDAVLSPQTCAATAVAMAPVWVASGRKVKRSLGEAQAPVLALTAAFSFTVMMFNIPALGGTTAHPVCGTLMALLLGPWAATVGLSVALAIQALLFGDGGLLAYGANCFTMAFVLPFVGYTVYRLCLRGRTDSPGAVALSAGVGAYVGIVAAAAIVGVLLGIQPVLFHDASGHALYFPFGMRIAVPAMVGAHALIAGPAEAIITAAAVRAAVAAGVPLYGIGQSGCAGASVRRETLWAGMLALAALSPLGLLAKGEAWGEWDAEGLRAQTLRIEGRAYVPRGIAQAERRAYRGLGPMGDYFGAFGALGYAAAAVLGGASAAGVAWAAARYGIRAVRRPAAAGGSSIPVRSEASPAAASEDLPAWLIEPATVNPPAARRSNPFVERTLAELAASASQALRAERWASADGFLQRMDARAKLVTALVLILTAVAARRIETLGFLYALALALALISRIPAGILVRRTLLTLPALVGAIALPLALSSVTPGREVVVLWRSPHVALSGLGLYLAGRLAARVAVCVSLAALLTLTTTWTELLRALRALLAPRLFVSVLAMTHRYVGLLMQTADDMFTARRSRTVGAARSHESRRYVGSASTALIRRSLALSEEVASAMRARGYAGEPRSLGQPQWRAGDWGWTVTLVAAAATAIGLGA